MSTTDNTPRQARGRKACQYCGEPESLTRPRVGAVVCFDCAVSIIAYYVQTPLHYTDTPPWRYVPMRLVNVYKPTSRRWVQVLARAYDYPVTVFRSEAEARKAIRRTQRNGLGNDKVLRHLRIRALASPPKAIKWRKLA